MNHRRFTTLRLQTLLVAVYWLLICGTAKAATPPLGFSDISKIEGATYLVVFDARDGRSWLGKMNVSKDDPYEEISVSWNQEVVDRSAPFDVEGLCRLGIDEYLAAESGQGGKPNRLIRFTLNGKEAKVVQAYTGPSSGPNDSDNFEGLACLSHGEDFLIIVGDRAEGSKKGKLFWGWLRPESGSITFEPSPPFQAPCDDRQRDVSALYLDPSRNELWAVATKEKGPSRIYLLGKVDPSNKDQPIAFEQEMKERCRVEGEKVEGLGEVFIEGALFAIGSDNEKPQSRLGSVDGSCTVTWHP